MARRERARRRHRRLAGVVALGLTLALGATAAPASATKRLHIRVLSNRADLISGGDALVAVKLPRGVRARTVRMRLNHRNVTGDFAMRANGRYEGKLDGLRLGRNRLKATAPGARPDRIAIRNHPSGGPVFSGPQVQPWVCRNGSKRPKCQAQPTYEYRYKSSLDGGLHPYDPDNPPPDVAETTTQTGETVPFVVRTETGYQDRHSYKIAVLVQPGKRWKPWNPQAQFNHKLLITHGASCGIDHQSGEAPSVTGDTLASSSPTTALGMGFAVMSTALDNAGHNCNLATEAESLVMAKEHLIESYGTLRTRSERGARAAPWSSSRWRTPTPGSTRGSCRSAHSRTRGPPASSSPPTTSTAPTSRTPRNGASASCGRRLRSPPWRAIRTTSTRSSSTPSTGPRSPTPKAVAPACRHPRATTRRRTLMACGARSPIT